MFWDNTAPIPHTEASVVKSYGILKSGYVWLQDITKVVECVSLGFIEPDSYFFRHTLAGRSVSPFENGGERSSNSGKFFYKTSVIAYQAKERPEAKQICWFGELFYCLNFFWICFGSSSSDDES